MAPTDNVAYLKVRAEGRVTAAMLQTQHCYQAQIAVHEGTPPESQRLVVAGATMQEILAMLGSSAASLNARQDERSLTSYGPEPWAWQSERMTL